MQFTSRPKDGPKEQQHIRPRPTQEPGNSKPFDDWHVMRIIGSFEDNRLYTVNFSILFCLTIPSSWLAKLLGNRYKRQSGLYKYEHQKKVLTVQCSTTAVTETQHLLRIDLPWWCNKSLHSTPVSVCKWWIFLLVIM